MSETTSTMTQRYGTPKRGLSPRAQRWGIIGALVIALAAAIYFTVGMAVGQLEYRDVGYTIHSDTQATVDYQVTKDFDATAQCTLHVLDDSYAIVGSRIVTLGPHEGATSADRSQYYRSDLRTEYRGVTGVVDNCWLLED
ncbi:DUF4307 domain-containing protein [Nesterenkonia flava]|uniref:DUF4307 domain-containing protein n=1 Tax=Nesterenkonia flava TaxID=469799 RepID=A0ABU1FQ88_9MICC|nr:DUF4307 domain-containing protein [Nesterenkonia flava]MDR5710815.1 DUF4307 domain-containing protein [Nesterenkonia flava]